MRERGKAGVRLARSKTRGSRRMIPGSHRGLAGDFLFFGSLDWVRGACAAGGDNYVCAK